MVQLPESVAKREVEGTPLAMDLVKIWQSGVPERVSGPERRWASSTCSFWQRRNGQAENLSELLMQGVQLDQAEEIAYQPYFQIPYERDHPDLQFDSTTLEPELSETFD